MHNAAQLENIRQAHGLGLHEDHRFHAECTICVETAFAAYLSECLAILRLSGHPDYEAFGAFFNGLGRDPLAIHGEPVYLVADFLGIAGTGEVQERDPLFQKIEKAAASLRQARLDI